MDNTQEDKLKTPKHRSPNFPAIGLEEALKKVKTIYDKDGMVGSYIGAIFENLGYSGRNGLSVSVFAALKKFNLIREENKLIFVTEFAESILTAATGEFKDPLIKEAALNPEMYSKLWMDFSTRIPSDPTLKEHLRNKYKFNEKSIIKFITDFRATLEFANLKEGEFYEKPTKDPKLKEAEKRNTGRSNLSPMNTQTNTQFVAGNIKNYLIPRRGDKFANLQIESPVSIEDIEMIQKWINFNLGFLKGTFADSKEQSQSED